MKNCIQFIIFTLSNKMHKSSKSYMLTCNQYMQFTVHFDGQFWLLD